MQQDFFVYLRVHAPADNYITGMKIPLSNITWPQISSAAANDSVIETKVPGPGSVAGSRVVLAGAGFGGASGGLSSDKGSKKPSSADMEAARDWQGWYIT